MPAHLTQSIASSLRGGHPWVFDDAIRFDPGVRDGDVVDLLHQGRFVARGMAEPSSRLAFRVWTLDERVAVDDALARERLEAAVRMRRRLLHAGITGFRACHGENDRFPGLQCDVYDGVASLRTDGRIGARHEDAWVAIVREVLRPRGVIVRNPHVDDGRARVVWGDVPQQVEIDEGGRVYRVDLHDGQKTGFFLDQRDNRDLVQRISSGRRVLNCFAYTGGFSIAAALGGAARVITNDIAGPAIATARENFTRNGLDPDAHAFDTGDAFDLLAAMAERPGEVDLIVVDPPSFVKNRKGMDRGLRAYEKLNALAMRALAPGGILVSASCSSHVREAEFLAMLGRAATSVGRSLTIAAVRGAGVDHPTLPGFPEGHYLKFVVAAVN